MIDFAAPITNQKSGLPQDSSPFASRRRFGSQSRTAGTMPIHRPDSDQLRVDYVPRDVSQKNANRAHTSNQQKPGFRDIVDVINPLHHLPIVGGLYRKLTGDEISSPAQFIGGFAYGGPIGAASALVDVAVKDHTGRGITDNVFAMANGDETAFAAKTPAYDAKWAHTTEPTNIEMAHIASQRSRFAGNARTAGLSPNIAPNTHFETMLQNLTT